MLKKDKKNQKKKKKKDKKNQLLSTFSIPISFSYFCIF